MRYSKKFFVLILLVVFIPTLAAQAPPTLTTLHSFVESSGANSASSLVSDPTGALYGTTGAGGKFNQGTVFQLKPPASPGKAWTYSVLYDFPGTVLGGHPGTGVVFGSGGVLYGVTANGGAFGSGTIFQLAPPAIAGAPWVETVLHSFQGRSDGGNPFAPLVYKNGALYGTANGGTSRYGVAFELAPNGLTWTYTLIHNFTGGGDGASPAGQLIFGSRGILYGLTGIGGTSNLGTVYQLVAPAQAGGTWTENVIYSFKGGSDGELPVGALVFDSKGNLYGTTSAGGAAGFGTIFELKKPVSSGAPWTESVLYAFKKTGDGANPTGALVFGTNGVLYGTTAFGGAQNVGTVFQVAPPASAGSAWTETVLHTFNGSDGSRPEAGVVFGIGGALYGTTQYGGVSNLGTLFELVL